MTKQQPRTSRPSLVDLALLRAATGGMQIGSSPRTQTVSQQPLSSSSTGVIGSPSSPSTSQPQIAPVQ